MIGAPADGPARHTLEPAGWKAQTVIEAAAGFLASKRRVFEGIRTLRLKKHLATAIATGLLLGVAPANADNPDYWLVRVSGDHTLFYFIDASTLTVDGPIRSVWLSEITAGQTLVKNSLRRRMIQILFDCTHNSSREERAVTFDIKARVLSDHSHNNSTFKQVIADSVEAVEAEFVCANWDHWTSRKGWSEIDAPPEKVADDDYKAFQARHAS